jgi:YD repeat-containing protein
MNSSRRSSTSRARWLVVFASCLLAATMVAIFVAPSASATKEPPAEELPAPDFSEIELEEAEHAEWLLGPEAESQREASRTAYTNLSAGEAGSLLLEAFTEQLKELNADPARVLSELEIEEPLDTYGALVAAGEGESAILESSVPVESDLGGEGKAPVDLTLEEQGTDFVPENPLTEVQLPGSAQEPVQLQNGLEVELPASDHEAETLGEMNLFYPATATDTDTLLAPVAGGVEVFEQLRSPESPEEFSFGLGLPAGATLQADEDGGAEVLSASEEAIAEVPPPTAVDAQGTEVPVTMSVEGDSLVLEVPHGSREVAYPLLVDPAFLSDTPALTSSEWHSQASGNYAFAKGFAANGAPYLAVWARNNENYGAGTDGQWLYTAPNETTFIEEATFGSIHFEGCQSQPHGYLALYNSSSKTFVGRGLYQVEGGSGSGSGGSWTASGGGFGYRDAVMGVGTALKSVKTTCVMEMRIHGATMKENDPEPPTITSVSGVPASGWFDPNKAGSATIVATDPGFGIKNISIFDGGVTNNYSQQPCTGLSGSRCQRELSWKIPPPYVEGERTLKVTTEDPLAKTATWTRTTKVDAKEPKIELGGQLAFVTEEEGLKGEENEASENQLSLPVYNLSVKAIDGNEKGTVGERQSGVKNIEVFLDGAKQEVPWKAQGCTQSQASCTMEKSYQLKLVGLSAGEHKLKVLATDQLDHAGKREIEFEYVPATGMKDDYVMQHFPLPDGEGDESEEEDPKRPELAVNVMNGNLVYRQRDVEVNGPAVDLELERFYNSQLPEEDNTQWGDGWTLAQTPKLEPEEAKEGSPTRASMLRISGAMTRAFTLPTETHDEHFSSKLGATVTKEAGGGYEVADQSGETANSLAFDASGKVTELRTPGYAKVEYGYEDGNLSEVAVHDPTLLRTVPGAEESKGGGEGEFEAPAYFASFGGESSGPGKLSAPAGIATDAEGNVWVADTGHRRIQKFNSEGEFISQFGADGASDGQFSSPRGIAVDSKGNVWVSDSVSSRVQKFNSKGEYLAKFGSYGTGNGKFNSLQGLAVDAQGHVWAVNAASGKSRVQEFSTEGTYLSQFGTSGSADGQLMEPKGVAIDAKGNIWVADTGNNRIQKFNSKGEYLAKFGSLGTGNGQLKSPSALSFDGEGNIWVTDAGNNRLEKFSSEGAYLGQFGAAGNKAAQFSEPHGIAIDAKDRAWVADTGNDRVQESTASEFVRKFGGEGSEGGQLADPNDAAFDSTGNLWVLDYGHNRVQKFDPEGKFLDEFGAKGTGDGLLLQPSGLSVDSEGNVWVADAGNYRIQEFNSKGEFIRKFGSKGTGNGKFTGLNDVAVDPEGRVWAVDVSSTVSRVEKFNSKGEYLAKFGSGWGTGNGQLWNPRSITADSKGNLWVADSLNYRVQEFNSKFEFIRKFGSGQGSGNGQFVEMRGIAVGPEGNVWVADSQNNRVQEFSGEGAYLGQFGAAGNNDGQLHWPQGVAVDAKGNVWVADTQNDRVQEFAASEFIRKFGGDSSGAGQLSSPGGVAAGSEGNVWVADTSHNRIQEFTAKGEFIRQFGSYGSSDGLFASPHGIAVDAEDNVWVVDTNNHRLQEFNPKGEFVRKFGSAGTENGKFESVEDVAIDSEGNLWTVDSDLARIQEFTPEGKFIGQFGAKGIGKSELEYPEGIAIDPEGDIWVANSYDELNSSRVEEFTAKGEFIRSIGSQGTGNGQFKHPSDLAFDSEGNLWVVDLFNDRIQVLSAEGAYLDQFGTAGAGDGQFDSPQAINVDYDGNVWIADAGNDRITRWQIPRFALKHSSVYASSLAEAGSGGGQLEHPGDVALDSEGNVWVADEENNRIAEFDEAGEFIQVFGSEVNETAVEAGGSEAEKNLCTAASTDTCQAGQGGSAAGYLSRPTSLAVDANGDILVADAGNSRIQKFGPEGKYLSKFGSNGGAAGQFREPEGIAVDSHGNIWVSDTYNGRVQEFNEAGELIRVVGSYGFDPGQLGEPTGIDIGPAGNVWIADWLADRVEVFSEKGKFIRQFGTEGTANGQFRHPDALAIDDRGQLWVAEEGDRVQAFTGEGEYVAQFGTKGTDEGQFEFGYPIGMETDSDGNLWIADSGNDRVQQWGVFNYVPADEGATEEAAPKVEVEESEGVVTSVEGEEAGQTDYSHDGELLTAVEGPKGETAYEYDEAERLTKVTLPNGTWGEVKYDSIGRVKSVTVSIEGGKVKTTHFTYSDEPRRTVVEPEGEDTTTYDIGADGSVLQWSYTPTPPTIKQLEGSLYAQRGEVHPETISPGDQTLNVEAESTRGIASIQIVANGTLLASEKTCEQDYEKSGTECVEEELSFVTETENWAPGILQLEVIATDSTGASSSVRFWDNIPYTPPPDPEVPEPPKFSEVKSFREEFGLDLDLKGNEQAINERIFQLIADWHDPSTSEGEVARATQEDWGVPLRAADAAELEYRDSYITTDADLIEEWAEVHYPTTYAGYYVDEKAGGIFHVGFTQDQNTRLNEISQQLPVMGPDRLAVYPTAPSTSQAVLDATAETLTNALNTNAELASLVTELEVGEANNVVLIGAKDVGEVATIITGIVGSKAPVSVVYQPSGYVATSGRNRTAGRMRAGDRIVFGESGCTAAFGAFEDRDEKSSGEHIRARFILSAGHCAPLGETIYRVNDDVRLEEASESAEVGTVNRNAIHDGISTDGLAIRVKAENLVPHGIYGTGGKLVPYKAATKARNGNHVCYSGGKSHRVSCGRVVGRKLVLFPYEVHGLLKIARIGAYKVRFNKPGIKGDSGSPVWNRRTHAAIGVISGGLKKVELVTPLLHPKRLNLEDAPGILHAPGMYSPHLITSGQ